MFQLKRHQPGLDGFALPRRGWKLLLLPLLLAFLAFSAGAQSSNSVISTAAQVRQLSPAQAESRLPVQLRGVVTFFDENLFSRFIQDETAGIYLRESATMPPLRAGDLVEVSGVTEQGEYAPVVVPTSVRVLGTSPLPAAKLTSFEKLASGPEDSQFVELSGVVRSVRFDEPSQHYVLTLVTGGGRLSVFARHIPVPPEALVDATLRVRGVCSTLFNRRRQLFANRLMAPRPEDLIVESAAEPNPWGVPSRTIASLLQFSPEGTYGRRVKLSGVVVLNQPGRAFFIQDKGFGLQVFTTQTNALQLGDRVEVLGFPSQGVYTPLLEDAVYRRISSGPSPEPQDTNVDAALSGTYDSRLIRLEAKLLDRARQSREQFLVLECENFIFQAHLEQQEDGTDAFAELKNNSLVSVAGICLIEPGEWKAGEQWRARSFKLLLRAPSDVTVLKEPPWWTLRKLFWIVGVLLLVVLATFAWVAVLRRKVQQQTRIIREQMIADAALKERYEDLFENASDMVFTHDLSGRITSINRAGEKLLQRTREQLLNTELITLLADDVRATAQDWLEQVGKSSEPQAAEWVLLNSAGQRVKVEISSRLVEHNGKEREIESVARDITERRRLERELLEISNREQRRIGHDLHDGVCQQLAAIAYRVDTLGELLLEAKRPEAAEAEKIASLIGEATAQARSVARGLFPVRLEENGLLAALEELADGASNRFPVECIFECLQAPPALDNDKALHLYYIAQEALVNAVKHGRAVQVQITIKKRGERHCLSIRDNGAGFQMPPIHNPGMGIRIMHHRAKVIGGSLEIKSAPGEGAEIVCYFAVENL